MKKRGQLFLLVAIGVMIGLIIGMIAFLQLYDSQDFTNEQHFNQEEVGAFYNRVTTCLSDLSYRFIKDAGPDAKALEELLRIGAPICFNESLVSGMEVSVALPFSVMIEQDTEYYYVTVSITTQVVFEETSSIIDDYTFGFAKKEVVFDEEKNETENGTVQASDEIVFIEVDNFSFIHNNFSVTEPETTEIIISYTNISENTTAYDSLMRALPIVNRRFFYLDEDIERYLFEKKLYTIVFRGAFDEIVEYESENITFEGIKDLLMQFDFVENVSLNAEYAISDFKRIYILGEQDGIVNDEYFDYQWYLENKGQFFGIEGADINIKGAWSYTKGSSNVTIAIIDQGIYSNDDYEDSILFDKSYNYVEKTRMVTPRSIYEYHGTHVAGVIASSVDNNVGIAGVCPECSIISMRVFDASGKANSESIVKATFDSVKAGADIVSLSLGGDDYSAYEDSLYRRLYNQGVVIVAAAGNDGASTITYPAAYKTVIGVGATTNRDTRAYFSNHGNWVNVYAPGENILSYCRTDKLCFDSGTSMATPLVSGIVGLMKSYNESLSPRDITSILLSTADVFEGNKKRVNAGAALQRLEIEEHLNVTEVEVLNETTIEEMYYDVIARRNAWVLRRENGSTRSVEESVSSAFSKADDLGFIVGYCNSNREVCRDYCAQHDEEWFVCRLV